MDEPVEASPTLESLTRRIAELERKVRDLEALLRTQAAPVVIQQAPLAPIMIPVPDHMRPPFRFTCDSSPKVDTEQYPAGLSINR